MGEPWRKNFFAKLIEVAYGSENLIHPIVEFFDNLNLAKEIWAFVHDPEFDINQQNRDLPSRYKRPLNFVLSLDTDLPISFLQKLISNPTVDVNVKENFSGFTPLIVCKNTVLIETLLARDDLKVNSTDTNGDTALLECLIDHRRYSTGERLEKLKLLLKMPE